jgi:hypothetical protein
MVRKHFDTMESAGCQASYSEFEFAHLDFTFANHEELMAYVTSRLSLVAPLSPGKIIPPLEETPSSRKLTGSLSSEEHHKPIGKPPARERSRMNGNASPHCNSLARNGEILEEVPESEPSPATTSKLKSS